MKKGDTLIILILLLFVVTIISLNFIEAPNDTNSTVINTTCSTDVDNLRCCLGNTNCTELYGDCLPGYKEVFRGCDGLCKPITRCDYILPDTGGDTTETDDNVTTGNETDTDNNETTNDNQESQRERFEVKTGVDCPTGCFCQGSVMTCTGEEGREMTVYAGESGNVIIQVKGVNMTTNVTLYRESNGSLIGKFRDGERKIKIFPDEVKQKIEEKIKTEIVEEEISLNEDGDYIIKAKKRARLFFIIPVKERIQTTISSETGEIQNVRVIWWGFLAKNSKIKSQ